MVDGGGNDVVADSQCAEHRFHSTGGTEQVACHRLGGADIDPLYAVAEYFLNGFYFGDIAYGGRCAMHIDVIDILGFHVGILQGVLHGEDGTETFGMCGGEVVSVGRHPSACYFCIYLGSACDSVLEFLKNKNCGSFADHESVAALAERT